MMPPIEPNDHERALEREEVLLGRVVDREATPDDWAELERLSDHDPALWTRLAHAERAHARLCAAVDDAIAIAECVELPRADPATLRLAGGEPDKQTPGRHGWASFIRHHAGWALAACLALVLGAQLMPGRGSADAPGTSGTMTNGASATTMSPGLDAPALAASEGAYGGIADQDRAESGGVMRFANYSPEDLWSGYVRRGAVEGRVLREMPAMVVEVLGMDEEGMYEVLVERRVLERRRISATGGTVMRVSVDEFGRPVMVPAEGGASDLHALFGPRESPI